MRKESKQLPKLTYKEQKEYDSLSIEIEKLEIKIHELEKCISSPDCYQLKGIAKIGEELKELKTIYETKVEKFLAFEEIIEKFNSNI